MTHIILKIIIILSGAILASFGLSFLGVSNLFFHFLIGLPIGVVGMVWILDER